jgi:hypothetical protein
VTLAGGVILLIVTQILTRFVVDPLVEFRRLLGEVAYTLILNSHLLYNPNATANTPEFQEARRQCRALASRLHAFSAAVPLYDVLARIGLVPARVHVYDAAKHLIGLSNTTATHPPSVVDQNYQRISQLLRIRVD